MTLHGVITLILRFFSPNSIALQAYYVTVVEDRPILSAEYCLPLLAKTDPLCSAVSFFCLFGTYFFTSLYVEFYSIH